MLKQFGRCFTVHCCRANMLHVIQKMKLLFHNQLTVITKSQYVKYTRTVCFWKEPRL